MDAPTGAAEGGCMRTLKDNLLEDRRLMYDATVKIGFDNDMPHLRLLYAICKSIYDILVWILEKKYLQ